MPDAVSPPASMFEPGRLAQHPLVDRIPLPELVKIASTRFNRPFIALPTTFMELTPRKPYADGLGSMDIYMPGRWDTSSNYIDMDAIVQGQSAGDWTGSVVYAQFTLAKSGKHLLAVHFSGYQTTMRLYGPWGINTAYTATTQDAGVVLAYADSTAGQTVYFTVNCASPNNMPGSGALYAIEAFS